MTVTFLENNEFLIILLARLSDRSDRNCPLVDDRTFHQLSQQNLCATFTRAGLLAGSVRVFWNVAGTIGIQPRPFSS